MINPTARALIAMSLIAVAGSVDAQEPDNQASDEPYDTTEVAVSPPVRITFAPPELSGRFVVGVFDADGFLVRTLMTDEDESVFDIGLNGFITSWDGKTSDGKDAASGRYSVRGYVVGGIEVEGVAYHFNDWVAEGWTDWQIVADCILVAPDRLVALVARDSIWTLVGTPIDGKPAWQTALGEDVATAPVIQADAEWVVIRTSAGLEVFSSIDGKPLRRIDGAGDGPFSVRGGRLVIASGKQIIERSLPDGNILREWEAPGAVAAIAALQDGAAVVLEAGKEIVWTTPEGTKRVELDVSPPFQSLTAGADGRSVWIGNIDDGVSFVREVNPDDGVVRELRIEKGEPLPVRISATETRLGLLYAWDRSTRWTCLERGADAKSAESTETQTVDWTIIADRRVVGCKDFGIASDGLVADGTDEELPDSIQVKLRPNPLDPNHPDTLIVEARSEDGRIWLTADNGLQLLPLSEANGWSRVALIGDAGDIEATLYQGNGWVVEEFSVSGLDQISSFDGGTFLLGPPATQP